MGNTSRFWKGVIFGAIAGGAVALLDRETRNSVMESCKKTTSDVSYYLKHPNEAVEQVKEKTNKLRATFEQVSEDVTFIAEKVEELREATPAMANLVKDTKEAFTKEDQEVASAKSEEDPLPLNNHPNY